MTPAECRTACIQLLAQIDQPIAECEDLADQPLCPLTNRAIG